MEFTTELKIEAKELFLKMYNAKDPLHKYPMCFDTAKQCTLIAIENTIEQLKFIQESFDRSKMHFYWMSIKKYIETMTKETLQNEQ